jgi:HSP20 family protein
MPRRTSDTPKFDHIRERMEQARRRVIGAPGSPAFSAPFLEPPVDIYETNDEVVVLAEISGVAREDIELEVAGTTLYLRGDRKTASDGPKRDYRQIEITRGPFLREVLLPANVNPEAAQTVYKDGMLQITLPKASPVAGNRFKIPVR